MLQGTAWIDPAGRTHSWPEWREWLGKRAGAWKLAPRGFPASKRFRPRSGICAGPRSEDFER
jgi:topoisomerase-4 subunit A